MRRRDRFSISSIRLADLGIPLSAIGRSKLLRCLCCGARFVIAPLGQDRPRDARQLVGERGSLSPESLHQVTWLMGDRGLPISPMHMNGYGSHAYSFINAKRERCWVKFHFKTQQGIKFYTNREAEEVIGKNRESSQATLLGAIEKGDFPKWTLFVQIMPEADVDKHWYNPFDLTKVWPHGDYPLIEVGVMELNRNPENYFQEIELAAFSPSNVVSGISWSPDKMLQARIFSYADGHRYRLGTHYEALIDTDVTEPISKDCPVIIGGAAAALDCGNRSFGSSSPLTKAQAKNGACFRRNFIAAISSRLAYSLAIRP
jgi:hypothetical protein